MDFEVSLRATYADTDQMGFVHHSNYLKYLEYARRETFRNFGLTYKEIEALGILMPVIDVKLRFLKPIYYDDLVTIKMQLNLMSPTKLSIDYKLYNTSGEVIHIANEKGISKNRCIQFVIEMRKTFDKLIPGYKKNMASLRSSGQVCTEGKS